MASIHLDIYSAENKHEIEKTYTVSSYDLMMGTLEDFMQVIDVDKLGDNMEVAKMVMKGYSLLRPLMQDVFEELTDDEWRRVRINDLILAVVGLGQAVLENLEIIRSGNVPRA